MIYADIFYQQAMPSVLDETTVIKGFVIKGHAGMAEAGQDIVCAAVSILSQTALLGLDAYLSGKFTWTIEDDGFLECWLAEGLDSIELEKSQIIIHTMELGLRSMEESYGQYLQVRKRRWTECCSN